MKEHLFVSTVSLQSGDDSGDRSGTVEKVKRHHKLLTDTILKAAKAGRYGDRRGGNGLSLLVRDTPSGRRSKSWNQRVRVNGKLHDIGLGSYPEVPLYMAREKARGNAMRAARGEDILKPPPPKPTLAELFHKTIDRHAKDWKSTTTSESWYRSLAHCGELRSKLVSDITREDIVRTLEKIWHEKPETAKKLRTHLSTILGLAVDQGLREKTPMPESVARELGKQRAGQHMKSVDFKELAQALILVRDSDYWWARRYCFMFLVFTGVRSGEARMATWEEINLGESMWTIPGDRMKNGIEHKVPVSVQVKELLLHAQDRTGRTSGVIFPPQRGGDYLNKGSLAEMVRELGIPAVPHGSRATFINWSRTQTHIARAAAEMVLAHKQGTETERAYDTSDFYEYRGPIMLEWANVLSDIVGEVIATEDRANYTPRY